MKHQKLWFAVLALPLLTQAAGDGPLDRATLRGVTAVNVVIDKLDPQLEKEGIGRDALQSRLEEKLRGAGVPLDPKHSEFVAIRLTPVRAAKGPYAVAMTIGLYQPVQLSRDPKIRTATQTWEIETVLLAEPKLLYRACMDSIDDLAARFSSAYKSANPK